MSQTGLSEMVRGEVEAVNEKGVKVNGRWLNYSQFSQIAERPEPGHVVELEVAKGRFVNALKIVGGSDATGAALDDGDPFAAFPPAPRAAQRPAGAAPAPAFDRNTEIRRLALVKAAAEYAAQRSELTPDDVVGIAAQWEDWVAGK